MRHVLKMFPKTHITIAAATSVVVAAAILMSPSADVEANRMAYSLDLDEGTVKSSGKPTPRMNEQPAADKMPEEDATVAPELAAISDEPQLPEALDTAAAMAEVSEPELAMAGIQDQVRRHTFIPVRQGRLQRRHHAVCDPRLWRSR